MSDLRLNADILTDTSHLKRRVADAVARVFRRWSSNSSRADVAAAATSLGLLVAGNCLGLYEAHEHIQSRLADDDSLHELAWGCFATGRAEVITSEEVLADILGAEDSTGLYGLPPAIVDPFDVTSEGGTIGAVAEWILSTARKPIPAFAMLSSIALHCGIFGRRLATPTGLGLNLFLVEVAGTGRGKDHALRMPEVIARAVGGLDGVLGLTSFSSDSAIESQLRHTPCCVAPWDEFGIMLQAMTGKNAPAWTASIRRTLLELHNASMPGRSWKSKVYADAKRNAPPIMSATFTVLGASTPEMFYAGLQGGAEQNGFLNRLVAIAADDLPTTNDIGGLPPVPAELVERLQASFLAVQPPGRLSSFADATTAVKLREVPWADDDARLLFRELERRQERACESDPDAEGIIGRAADNTLRLATLSAASFDPANPAVTVDDIEWGWAIVRRSLETLAQGVERYMAGSEAEAFRKLILGHIKDAGPEGIQRSLLMKRRGVKALSNRMFEDAIRWLIDAGDVKNIIVTTKGRPTARYVATQMAATV